ncbi:MAG: hypothetical protein F6K31_32850 [Symploca sp. SIO2G7]|nr:hypothetical protein [Symploca sp. SIO2G7]
MEIWRWGYLGLAMAIMACSAGQTTATDSDAASCGPMATQVPLHSTAELPFERFDFRPNEVEVTETTLSFKGQRYGFTFCKRDRTWGVQSLEFTPASEADYLDYYDSLANPDYKTVTSQTQTYQARVRLDAPWLVEEQESNAPSERVIFELIKPGENQPVAQVLYTNTDIVDRELGSTAGVPTITRTLTTADALWWAIGFEQGEGASGITTVVQYQIQTDQIVLWQPSELGNAQITDLALTTVDDEPILWLGTQYSGEGNPYLPAKGLVAYRPTIDTIQAYTTENSPLIGAIPTRLWAEDTILWVATGNGVCAVQWATIAASDSWDCWQFTARANVADNQALYASLLADLPFAQLDAATSPVELLWLAETDIFTPDSPKRYEIGYDPGIVTQLNEGADYYVEPKNNIDDGYFWWPGKDWSWNGQRFVRPWDQVAVNHVGGGPQGIGPSNYGTYVSDWQIMRGEFELLNLTQKTTDIRYYSAWIDAAGIEPWVTVTKAANPPLDQINPTEAVLMELKQVAR